MKPCEISNIRSEISAITEVMNHNPKLKQDNDLVDQLNELYNQLDAIQNFESYREEYVDPFQVLVSKSKMTHDYYDDPNDPIMSDRY